MPKTPATGPPQRPELIQNQVAPTGASLPSIALMKTPKDDERIARLNLASSICKLLASVLNLARVAIEKSAPFFACWLFSLLPLPAAEMDRQAPKVVAAATAPGHALGVDRG